MKLNLSKVNVENREFIKKAGSYTLKVVDVKKDSSKNGKALLVFDFINKDNLHFEHRFTMQESTMSILKRFIDTLGIDTNIEFETNDCIGCYIIANLEFESYNGKKYIKCTRWEKSEAKSKEILTIEDESIPF